MQVLSLHRGCPEASVPQLGGKMRPQQIVRAALTSPLSLVFFQLPVQSEVSEALLVLNTTCSPPGSGFGGKTCMIGYGIRQDRA